MYFSYINDTTNDTSELDLPSQLDYIYMLHENSRKLKKDSKLYQLILR